MKNFSKLIILTALFIGCSMIGNAQEIGVRFGNISGGNVAIDAVFSTGEFSRIHADFSVGDGDVALDVLWDFVYMPLGDETLNWYAGVGPYAVLGDPFWMGAIGEIGLEYKFDSVPISISADYRPSLSIIEETKFHYDGFGINIRYNFGRY